ncbi:hypothetical protein ACFLYV_04245 [Chloroflexota bacterium]
MLYQYPGVIEAAVFGVPDEQWGEAVQAIIALKPGINVTEREIIAFCQDKLARYKIPKSVEFQESLPKSDTGKILTKELREPYWKGREKRIN